MTRSHQPVVTVALEDAFSGSREMTLADNIIEKLRRHPSGSEFDKEETRYKLASAFYRYIGFGTRAGVVDMAEMMRTNSLSAKVLMEAEGILSKAAECISPLAPTEVSSNEAEEAIRLATEVAEVEFREVLAAIEVIHRHQESHALIAESLRRRIDAIKTKTSEGELPGRNLLLFEVFKVCCEVLGLDFRFVGMTETYKSSSKSPGFFLQTLLREAWQSFSGEEISEARISQIIRKQNKKRELKRKTT